MGAMVGAADAVKSITESTAAQSMITQASSHAATVQAANNAQLNAATATANATNSATGSLKDIAKNQ
ncbi:hypothetical protein BLA18112_00361 [Burkholderia lata]|uniref:Uncharacterized protein n=1 Tax=Burkholderia lata (strain ATCC 17760 / DSM 23089 / LMG 22485 / NCIMB 9086 / R18194 / 383) TaxID=482957 RepID=A0A6P2SZR6_BURL3|nr:hypothetical protein [Burkholderia lata]VWC56476.1 hypothetical protein BLA18112_00361 [Burkholderia lata]